MNDPYVVLGVSPTASDDEIKKAYRELTKKYHPDRYSGSPMEEMATDKMAEINAAYDEIMNIRRGKGSSSYGGSSSSYGGNSSYGGSSYSGSGYGYNAVDYSEVRRLINAGSITSAERILDNVDITSRTAEWYFLKGSICYKRGWLNEAFSNFSKAYAMEPSNTEYASAVDMMSSYRQGNMKGKPDNYSYNESSKSGCNPCCCCGDDACSMCQGLICADCCCECMGGDLIPCC